MVEPEIAENTVPATIAITERRPGTRRISSANASIALSATPVWNSTSPISTKNGIGVSEKLVTEKQPRAHDVQREERERHRQPEPHDGHEAAEQNETCLDPAHRCVAFSRPRLLRGGACAARPSGGETETRIRARPAQSRRAAAT